MQTVMKDRFASVLLLHVATQYTVDALCSLHIENLTRLGEGGEEREGEQQPICRLLFQWKP